MALRGKGEKHNATENTKPWRVPPRRNTLDALRLSAERVDNIVLARSTLHILARVKCVLYLFQLTACWEENKPHVMSRTCLWSSVLTEPSNSSGFTSLELQRKGQIRNQCAEQTVWWSHVYTTGKERRWTFKKKQKQKKPHVVLFYTIQRPSFMEGVGGKWWYNFSKPP